MTCSRLILRWGCLVPLGMTTWSMWSQERLFLDVPNALNSRITEMYLQTDVEADHEAQEAGTPNVSVSRQRIIVQPVLGLGLAGWAYHPNLLEYTALTELGLGYWDTRVDPGNASADTKFLQRYHVSLDILKQKQFATTLFADKDMTYRDYDFFSRVPMSSERFGARSGYSAGAVPFYVSYQHYAEDVQAPNRPTRQTDDTLSFNANNLRRSEKGSTQINYNLSQFSQQDDGFSTQHGLNQNLNVTDNENFGALDWVHMGSLLNFNSVAETAQPSERLLFQQQLQLQHTPRLRSFYEYQFNNASAGASDASVHEGSAGLSKQLFENLTSTFDGHGNITRANSPGGSLDASRYGGTLSEQYTRTLGTWGNLTLGYTGGIDRESRVSSGGQVEIINEKHTLTDGTLTFLNQNFAVESSIHVTDTTGTITYRRELDYRTSRQGALTEIRRVPGGTIPNGGVVFVNYTAALDPSAKYTWFQNAAYFRLDFENGLFGIYGRWSTLDYSGSDQLNLRWLDDKTIGVDITWRWLRAGAEHQVVDSNLSPYDRSRLFQSADFRPSDLTTLGLQLDQSWANFRDNGTRQTSYGLIAHYQQRLTSALAWSVEGGLRIDQGNTFDGNYAAARTELDWAVGKLTVKLGYQYGNETHPSDQNTRHYFYLRFRRYF